MKDPGTQGGASRDQIPTKGTEPTRDGGPGTMNRNPGGPQ